MLPAQLDGLPSDLHTMSTTKWALGGLIDLIVLRLYSCFLGVPLDLEKLILLELIARSSGEANRNISFLVDGQTSTNKFVTKNTV